MNFDVLHNFISPVTGRILVDTDYIIVGNDNGIGDPSPILIDLQLDLINLRANYNILRAASFVVGFPNDQLSGAQVLNSMENGYMYNTNGIVSTSPNISIDELPDLTDKKLWIGNEDNRPVEAANIEINNLPNLTFSKVWVGDGTNRPIEANNFGIDNLPDLTNKKLWIGNRDNRPIEATNIEINNLPNLTYKKAWVGNIFGRPQESSIVSPAELEETKLELEGKIDLLELEVEAELAALEFEMELEFLGVEAEFAGVELEFLGVEAEFAALEAEIELEFAGVELEIIALAALLELELAGVEFEIAALAIQLGGVIREVDTLDKRLNNLRLNNIFVDGDVSLYNYRIVNLADPVNSRDAVTKSYVDSMTGGGSVTLTGAVTGSGPLNAPIFTTFIPNPVFTGNEAMTIPVGETGERPVSATTGMIRYNTDL